MQPFHCYPPYHAYARYIQNLYKVRSLINRHSIDLSGNVLDYGSGSGALAAVLADLCDPCSLTAYEPRIEAIEDSRRIFPRVSNCVTSDHSSLQKSHYNIIFCQYVIAYVDSKALFKDLYSLLASDGIIILEVSVPDLLSRLQGFGYSEWQISSSDYNDLFQLSSCSPSVCNNRSFDFTSTSYIRLKLKQMVEPFMTKDSRLYIFRKV